METIENYARTALENTSALSRSFQSKIDAQAHQLDEQARTIIMLQRQNARSHSQCISADCFNYILYFSRLDEDDANEEFKQFVATRLPNIYSDDDSPEEIIDQIQLSSFQIPTNISRLINSLKKFFCKLNELDEQNVLQQYSDEDLFRILLSLYVEKQRRNTPQFHILIKFSKLNLDLNAGISRLEEAYSDVSVIDEGVLCKNRHFSLCMLQFMKLLLRKISEKSVIMTYSDFEAEIQNFLSMNENTPL